MEEGLWVGLGRWALEGVDLYSAEEFTCRAGRVAGGMFIWTRRGSFPGVVVTLGAAISMW